MKSKKYKIHIFWSKQLVSTLSDELMTTIIIIEEDLVNIILSELLRIDIEKIEVEEMVENDKF